MQYGIRPSATRSIEDLLKMAEIARKKFFDSFWFDQGVGGLSKAMDLAKQCITHTKRAFYSVFYHPQSGDDLYTIAQNVLEFQKTLNGFGYLVVAVDQFATVQEQTAAAIEIGKILVPLVQKLSVKSEGEIFRISNSSPFSNESIPVRVYLDTRNVPELIGAAGQFFNGVISYPTLEFFKKVFELVADHAEKTENDLHRFDFVLSLPTFFGSNDFPDTLKSRVLQVLSSIPPETRPSSIPNNASELTIEQIQSCSWSGNIYDINEKLMDYYSAFGDIGNPENRLPLHIVVEEPFGPDAFAALSLVADESAYNYRIPFATLFEKEIRNVKDWRPPSYD